MKTEMTKLIEILKRAIFPLKSPLVGELRRYGILIGNTLSAMPSVTNTASAEKMVCLK